MVKKVLHIINQNSAMKIEWKYTFFINCSQLFKIHNLFYSLLFLFSFNLLAQPTQIYFQDFETSNDWTLAPAVSGNGNYWVYGIGTTGATTGAATYSGTKSLQVWRYVNSSSSYTANYNGNSTSQYTRTASKTFNFAAYSGVPIIISYWVLVNGETGWDDLRVTVNGTVVDGPLTGITSWQKRTIDLSTYAGNSSVAISFEWRNDGSTQNQPAARIDDIEISTGVKIFNYTGSNQTYTVPTGVCQIEVIMWGAGGGGAYCLGSNCGSGGSGGYVKGLLNVTAGQVLTIQVGKGGNNGDNYTTLWGEGGWPGGGNSGGTNDGGGGGGYSGIFSSSTINQANALAIAGGGGGGSRCSNSSRGGEGGSNTGGSGVGGCSYGSTSTGGTQTAGGSSAGSRPGNAGSALQGGKGYANSYDGGGGGGGYFGGAGGSQDGGGGGGSNYASLLSSIITNSNGNVNTAGGTANAPNNTNSYYSSGIGIGGAINSNGGNGKIVITNITSGCCATTTAGSMQYQNTIQNLCYGQTVSANNITSTSLNAGNGTLRTVWFVGEWGWTGTAMGWINWRESTPGTPAGGVYSTNLNTAVGGVNGDGQTMTNYNPQIDFPNNNRFYIIRGSYNSTCASWCMPNPPSCVYQGFEVIISPPIPTPTATNGGPLCENTASITLSADGLAPSNKSLAATTAAAQMTIPNATLGASWTLEAWSRFPLNASGTYNTLFRNAGGGGGGGDHQILTQNGILGSYSNTGTNGPLGFKSSGFDLTTLSAGWHHVAAVATGGITKFYIDGTIVGQISWQSDNSVQLINGLSATQAWGEIDNARIWNTARSVANILSDMHRNVPLLDLGNLIANYTFDGSNGNDINNGTYNSTGIIDCAYNDVSYFTYTWTGTNAPAASTSVTQTVTNPQAGTYSLIASENGCSSAATSCTIAVQNPPSINAISPP